MLHLGLFTRALEYYFGLKRNRKINSSLSVSEHRYREMSDDSIRSDPSVYIHVNSLNNPEQIRPFQVDDSMPPPYPGYN